MIIHLPTGKKFHNRKEAKIYFGTAMIIHLPTGKKFHNRKEAKIYFGTAYYYKMEREKNI